MNKRIYLLLSVGFIMIALLGAVCLYQGIQIKQLQNQVDTMYEQAVVDIGQNDNAYKQLVDLRNQDVIYNHRLGLLEEAMWLEGYEHTEYESMPHMNNRLLQKDFRAMLMNRSDIMELEKRIDILYGDINE